MKRFYLIMCFLMSVMGSAWGQETDVVTIAPTTLDEVKGFISDGFSNNQISVEFATEADESKGSPAFKFNYNEEYGSRYIRITPNSGVTITKVIFYGIDSKRQLVVNDLSNEASSEKTLTTTDDATDNWTTTYEPETSEASEAITFSTYLKGESNASNAYVTKIEVTYTYTTTPVESITLNQTSASLKKGGNVTLTATVLPDGATDKAINWSSSDDNIAKVDDNGLVTAVSVGTATITATANDGSGVTATCDVTVEQNVATAIALNKTTAIINKGNTETLTETLTPADATTETTWATSDASIATVDNGVVTAVAPGVAYITATNNEQTATCTVIVPSVLSVGSTEAAVTLENITAVSGVCDITKAGQLMDAARNNPSIQFQVSPTESGTYSFTSTISTKWQERSVTLTCGEQSEEKTITPGGWNKENGQKYTWEFELTAGQTYTITVAANIAATDVAEEDENTYTVNLYDMTVVKKTVETQTYDNVFSISHFNYVTGKNANNDLNREAGGFTFAFSGGDALKCNSYDKLIFRTRSSQNGTMTISSTTGAKIMGAEFTCTSGVIDGETKYFTITDGDGNDLTSNATVKNGVVKLSLTTGVSKIVFAKKNVSETEKDNDKAFDLSSIKLLTDRQVNFTKVTETLTYPEFELVVGNKGTNTLTSTPQANFAANKFTSSDENVATVNATGEVTAVAAGTATITASFDGTDNKYYEAAEASYTINVIGYQSEFEVADFNYAGESSSKDNNLDRTIGGFSFTYTGGEAIKYNRNDSFFFRGKNDKGNNKGSLTIEPTDANNKILKLVIKSTKDVSAVEGFTVTADGTTVTPTLENGSITIKVSEGASSIVISSYELTSDVNIKSYVITTTDQPSAEKYQPTLEFEHSSLSVAETGNNVTNQLTITPKNYPVTYSSSDDNVATVDESGNVTPVAEGTTTITVSSTETDYFNAATATYTLTVGDDESVAGETWNFTTWSTADITTVTSDSENWEYNSNGYYKNTDGITKTDFNLEAMEGLLFTTTSDDQVRIYPNKDGQTDGSIRLQSKNAKIYMPALTAGQTITLTMKSASASSARGIVFSGAAADKVQLLYGAETSKTMNVVTYRVTEAIAAEELIMSASTGGLYLYSIELGYADLHWMDGSGNAITDVAVTEAGETGFTLNSTAGTVTYTITDAAGNESTDVTINNGKVVVNTFTLGNTHTITATMGNHNATLTLRMVNTAKINYEVTEVEGTLGLSFVEPVLTKDPEGLNVVRWKSSNPEVATVVETTGEVTLVSVGTTIITAYIEANNYYAYQEDSYTLTVAEAPEVQEPWTLTLVEAGDASVATGSTGHKLTMNEDGTIKAGQVTDAIPGLTLSFGKAGDQDWTVGTPESGYTTDIVAQGAAATVDEDTNYPTGGTYLGLEPTVNGVLSLDASYFASQSVVLVDKSTQTVVASYSAQTDEFADKEFSVPLQADHTYYLYNAGNGKSDTEYLNYALQIHAITFTPVFLDRIGHVIVKNNEYNITGAQLADDIHDYPTFSNVHAEEGGSVHYHSYQDDGKTENTTIYLDEDGNLVIDGEGTAILEAHVSHTNTSGDECRSIAKCTVTYTKSQLKFSGTDYTLASNLVESFTEPTLTLPAALSSSTVTYSVDNGFGIDSNTGNIINVSGSGITATVTATISPENIYFNPTATYTIKSATQQVPFEVLEEITVPVGTRAFSLIREDENGVLIDATGNVVIDLDDNLYGNGDGDQNTWGILSDMSTSAGSYATVVQKFFSKPSIKSTDPGVVKINPRMQIDALAEGTATVSMQSNQCTDGSSTYGSRDITIKINVVKDTESDYYESIYIGTGSTYRTWNFHNGFDATELSSYDNGYTALGNSTGEAENFITHIPSGHDFWIYDSENNTLKSKTSITVTDNKIDRESIAFIANEPMNGLSLTSTATNCFASSKGTIGDYRTTGEEPSYTYDDDDKNVLTFYTFRTAGDVWEGKNLNQVANITFNEQTNMSGITGVDKDEYVTPYKSIKLESNHGSAIRVNDIKPGMWMSVIADNNTSGKDFGRVQLASDGAEVQALGQSLYGEYTDAKDPDWSSNYSYNRVTNVFPYLKSNGKTVGIEPNGATGITNIMVGYPAGMGTLNVGGGEKSPKINNIQRTYGYATFVSPYNIDLTGQTALKAYICDYYGKDNNLVHMVQIKHIPANTPVMLKGYARDMYVLYISEGNKPVEHGISEEVFAKNRLVGAMEDGMMVQPTEEGLHNGAVTTWHNMGLTQNKFLTFTVASPIAMGRAYLRITQEEYEDLYAAHVSASAASTSTKIVFEDTDFDYSSDVTTPTGIENLENVTVTVGDGHYYNLNGVRVNGTPTQKGIYIRNGKKIVVR